MSFDLYQFRYGRFARALKNSQLTCGDFTSPKFIVDVWVAGLLPEKRSAAPQASLFRGQAHEKA
jgi:hypothetical protein